MATADANKPIVIKRVKKYAAGAHGGAWKVAFADFVTAMMALFLVLWLIESTTQAEKLAISMYFSNPTGYTEGGSPFVVNLGGGMRDTDTIERVSSPAPPTQEPDVMPDRNIQPLDNIQTNPSQEKSDLEKQQAEKQMQEQQLQEMHEQRETQEFEELKRALEEKIEADPTIGAFRDQIIIKITEDGLLIEVVDKDKRPMFDLGKTSVKPYFNSILKAIAKTLEGTHNPLSISGHTDAVPFTESENYTNWELSSDRANAARRALLKAGMKKEQIARVVGLADSILFDEKHPDAPINRRISILAMRTPPTRMPAPEEKDAQQNEAATPADPNAAAEIPGSAPANFGRNQAEANAKPNAKPVGENARAPAKPSLPRDPDFPPAGTVPSAAPAIPSIPAVEPARTLAAPPSAVPAVPEGLTPRPVEPSAEPAGQNAQPPVAPAQPPANRTVVPAPTSPDSEFF
ncbi:Chemotaxis protein MotB [gamma proteobacterium HdN1]|nr:Chemotaxis protein MotB [gamma proteobacterium HdN1]